MDTDPVIVPGAAGIPKLIATPSSNVHGIAFADGVLFLKFQGGKVYRYTGAPVEAHYHAMMKAESIGGYFARHVRRDAAVKCEYVGRVVEVAPQVERSPLADAIKDSEHCACGARITPGAKHCPACAPREQHETNDGV